MVASLPINLRGNVKEMITTSSLQETSRENPAADHAVADHDERHAPAHAANHAACKAIKGLAN
jgi:hypothetical protein